MSTFLVYTLAAVLVVTISAFLTRHFWGTAVLSYFDRAGAVRQRSWLRSLRILVEYSTLQPTQRVHRWSSKWFTKMRDHVDVAVDSLHKFARATTGATVKPRTVHCTASVSSELIQHQVLTIPLESWATDEAANAFLSAFPAGAELIETPTEAQRCALYAIELSWSAQLPQITAPTLSDMLTIVTAISVTASENFADDEADDILRTLGEQMDPPLRLRLGYLVRQGQEVIPILMPRTQAEDEISTLWIHNDNAIELEGAALNHWSGLRPASDTIATAARDRSCLTHCKRDDATPSFGRDRQSSEAFAGPRSNPPPQTPDDNRGGQNRCAGQVVNAKPLNGFRCGLPGKRAVTIDGQKIYYCTHHLQQGRLAAKKLRKEDGEDETR